jgi:hypothetical protein
MKYFFPTLFASSLISSGLFAAEIQKYEVQEETKDKHDTQFYEQSYQHEDTLNNLQIVLIVDKSGSQQTPDSHPSKDTPDKGMLGSGWTQWDNTFYAAKYLAESLFEYDSDGKIPVVFFGRSANDEVASGIGQMLVSFKKNKPTNETTNLEDGLKLAYEKHSTPTKADERILFIVLTDGSPNSGQEPRIKKLIEDNKKDYLKLLFIRIGDDPGATQFLTNLDDCAQIGDCVDTKSDNMMNKMGPKNLILNALYEHLDSQYTE